MDIHEMEADINYFVRELVEKIEKLEDENNYLQHKNEQLEEKLKEKYAPEPDYCYERGLL